MLKDESFLRAILANPDDRVSRLVYADWLDEHGEPARAEFLRLAVRRAEGVPDREERAAVRERAGALRAGIPSWWLALVGGLRVTSRDEPVFTEHVEAVARVLGQPAAYTDDKGYMIEILAGATCLLTGTIAYLECRDKWYGDNLDIHYHLRVRKSARRLCAWEPETDNPYFGCEPRVLEWCGDVILFLYVEKHRPYISRFGLNAPAVFQPITHDWILDGGELAYRQWDEPGVRRLSVPSLEALPELSDAEAAERDLLPKARWE
jgi:uncharacterized protein (TIGR02996 family)